MKKQIELSGCDDGGLAAMLAKRSRPQPRVDGGRAEMNFRKRFGFGDEALKLIEHTGADPREDADALRDGEITREELLNRCLAGAEPEVAEGWHDYVACIVATVAHERGV